MEVRDNSKFLIADYNYHILYFWFHNFDSQVIYPFLYMPTIISLKEMIHAFFFKLMRIYSHEYPHKTELRSYISSDLYMISFLFVLRLSLVPKLYDKTKIFSAQ